MYSFLDATHARMLRLPASSLPLVVLPSYNGARKLPLLTPLLAFLAAREGLPVLIHGAQTESSRVFVSQVLEALGPLPAGVTYIPTEQLCPGLKRLLDVRRTIGLRNASHSLVKLMNPCAGDDVVVGSFTHPESAVSMAAVYALMRATAMPLRGTAA